MKLKISCRWLLVPLTLPSVFAMEQKPFANPATKENTLKIAKLPVENSCSSTFSLSSSGLSAVSRPRFRIDRKFPIELSLIIQSYSNAIDFFNFADTCSTFRDELYGFMEICVSEAISTKSFPNKRFIGFIYIHFLDFVKKSFPQLRKEEIKLTDFAELCLLHAWKVENEHQKRAAELMRNCIGLKDDRNIETFSDLAYRKTSTIFSEPLYFTAEYLLAVEYFNPISYYDSLMFYSHPSIRSRFLKRVLEILNDPLNALHGHFDSEFAMLIFSKYESAVQNEILSLAAERLTHSKSFSIELVAQLATNPVFLQLALQNSLSNANWLHFLITTASSEQLLAADVSGRWASLKYMHDMKEFNEEEFKENVPYSIEAVLALPYFLLNLPCHYAAFINLITRPEADFSSPNYWNSPVLNMDPKQVRLSYWKLLCQHARNTPPILRNDINIFIVFSKSHELLEYLAPRLPVTDILFLLMKRPNFWDILIPHFRALDMSKPVIANYFEVISNNSIADKMLQELNAVLEWPVLHLVTALGNQALIKEVTSHPSFDPRTCEMTVAGYSLQRLNDFALKLSSFSN